MLIAYGLHNFRMPNLLNIISIDYLNETYSEDRPENWLVYADKEADANNKLRKFLLTLTDAEIIDMIATKKLSEESVLLAMPMSRSRIIANMI